MNERNPTDRATVAVIETFAELLIAKLHYAASIATMDDDPSPESYAEARALRAFADCVREAKDELNA